MPEAARPDATVGDIVIHLLADRPALVRPLATLRWAEWAVPGRAELGWWVEQGRADLGWWVDRTAAEAGRDRLPVTFVAVPGSGPTSPPPEPCSAVEAQPGPGDETVLGGVGLSEFDPPEIRDRSPWVVGMIVHPDHRGRGIGRALMTRAERYAVATGAAHLWVATGGPAIDFYRRCGWQVAQRLARPGGDVPTILVKALRNGSR